MSTTDLPGSSLLAGRYRLVERLGAGGMSVVWRGFDEVLGRQVAVKVLPPSTSTDPAFRRRLRAEAQAAARLSHPHITNVYDYGEATTVDGEPVPYVVMELIDGESLAAVLARVRRLPWQAAVRISAEVAAALAAAHSRGIVHRDVTPANVMLTPSGAKVVDFGISALIGENDIDPDGSLLGTPAYLAPERLEGGQVSPATDVYAVGLLIYRTLIGQLPWDVGTTTALLRAHQYTAPEPLPPVEGLPPAVAALVSRCLEKRPADRPSSAELAHVLAGVSADVPASGRGYAADWSSESGEDTTILPSQRSWTDGFGRQRARAVAGPIEPAPAPLPSVPQPHRVPPTPPLARAPVPVAAAAASALPPPSALATPLAASLLQAPAPLPGYDGQSGPLAGPAARNSRFASLRGGPVLNTPPAQSGPALRPALDNNQPPAPPGPPGSGGGQAGDGGNEGPTRRRRHTRRVLVVAAAVLALTVATFGWSLAAGPGKGRNTAGVPQASVIPPSGKCVVSYAVWSDSNGKFSAHVTLANRDDTAVQNWKLWFLLPGDQIISGNGKVQLNQDGNTVTVSSASTLNPQKALTMPITGRYVQNNSAPLAFKLNGATCETFVSSSPGQPSRKVENLTDGTTRLVTPTPTPTSGISVDSSGIVHITPTSGATSGGVTTTPTATATTTDPYIPPPPPTSESATTTTATTTPTTAATTATTTYVPPTSPSLEACDQADPTCTTAPA